MRAAELPYAHLYRYGRFTLAISKLSFHQGWPLGAHSDAEAVGLGLLHGSATFPDHGAEEPVLPVKLTFGEDYYRPDRFGSAHFDRSADDGAYLLYVHINDPTGDVLRALREAMQHGIASGYSFVHVHCVQDRDPEAGPHRTDYAAQIKEDREFLLRVESGDATLDPIVFDRVFFEDALVTKAPGWTWGWEEWEFEQPRFQSKAAAKWRREWLPHRLK